jgi:outer membrane protein assembly factor BamD (BamD/ComL family)
MKNILFVTAFLSVLSFFISACSAQKMEKVSLSVNEWYKKATFVVKFG